MQLPFDMTPDVAAMIGFFAIVSVLLFLDRKNIEFHYGLIIRRWKHGRQAMDKWIFSNSKILGILGTIGVIMAIGAPFLALPLMIQAPLMDQQGAGLVLPTAGDFQYPTSVIIGVPFWFWIVAIFIVLTVHEPMHAIYSRLAGVPVKSWGVMTFLPIPLGAFVDPDMKRVQKLKLMPKLKIFAGGSFGNFIAAGFFMLLLMLTVWATGFGLVSAQTTLPNTPAAEVGLKGDLVSIDGVEINGVPDLVNVLNSTPPGTEIEVVTEKGVYSVVTAASNVTDGSYLGVGFSRQPSADEAFVPFAGGLAIWMELLTWVIVFNLGIGLFNTLPMLPFDGGHVFHALYQRWLKDEKKAKMAIYATSLVTLGLVMFAILGRDLVRMIIA